MTGQFFQLVESRGGRVGVVDGETVSATDSLTIMERVEDIETDGVEDG